MIFILLKIYSRNVSEMYRAVKTVNVFGCHLSQFTVSVIFDSAHVKTIAIGQRLHAICFRIIRNVNFEFVEILRHCDGSRHSP